MNGDIPRQLFGESEGKDGKGLYPDAILFSTDMHSMGQYIQDGQRILLETGVEAYKNSMFRMLGRAGYAE